jgi:hypothetical protein
MPSSSLSFASAAAHDDGAAVFAALPGRLFGIAWLERLFASDVVSDSDDGGLVRAAGKPLVGAHHVARFLAPVARWLWVGAIVVPRAANGHRAVLIERDGAPYALLTIGASRSRASTGSSGS